jgi:3-deoxy-D-manno-octulosonic-acid transferase
MVLGYNLLLLVSSPLLALYLLHRLVVQGKSREGFLQRLGWAPRLSPAPPGGRVWLHAVSAGEVVAAAAVARRLAEVAPETEVVISTTTPAGQLQAEKLLDGAASRFYFPFDFLPCVALALLRVRPTVVAAVETEIWPNWLWVSRAMGIHTALVNGQFADRGFRGARRVRWLYRWALGRLEALWMQTRQAAERALLLGAPPERVRVVGNVKFEQQVPPLREGTAELVRSALALDQNLRLWVAGSTHPGEEEQILGAFRRARERVPGLKLVLAPRHVQRAPEVLTVLRAQGWSCGLRSTLNPGQASAREAADVLVLDTMGELAGLYALADVVFVGGSLVPVGGHDILQPLFHGKPVLFGPHMHNQHDLARIVLEAGGAVQVSDANELGDAVARLCDDTPAGQELKAAGRRLLQENAGAALECARLLARLARGSFALESEHAVEAAS